MTEKYINLARTLLRGVNTPNGYMPVVVIDDSLAIDVNATVTTQRGTANVLAAGTHTTAVIGADQRELVVIVVGATTFEVNFTLADASTQTIYATEGQQSFVLKNGEPAFSAATGITFNNIGAAPADVYWYTRGR